MHRTVRKIVRSASFGLRRCDKKSPAPTMRGREGFQLVEVLMAALLSGFLMTAMLKMASNMYTASTQARNQILASTMAQEIIDNARNTQYSQLASHIGNAVGSSATENITSEYLYAYPGDRANAIYPRPLLENDSDPNMVYSQAARNSWFENKGQWVVSITLTRLSPDSSGVGATYSGCIQLDVTIAWADSSGPHQYATGTKIAQSGIHN